MNKVLRFTLIVLLFITLAAVRYLERYLFYDPLLAYFDLGYLNGEELPAIHQFHFFLSAAFRYWLNTLLSLLLLYLIFLETSILKFSFLFYGSAFLILMVLYAILIADFDPEHYLRLFYVRRLLIQPVFIILLLPAFYYQKRTGRS